MGSTYQRLQRPRWREPEFAPSFTNRQAESRLARRRAMFPIASVSGVIGI